MYISISIYIYIYISCVYNYELIICSEIYIYDISVLLVCKFVPIPTSILINKLIEFFCWIERYNENSIGLILMLILWSIFNFENMLDFFISDILTYQNGYVQHISASIKILADEIMEDEKKKKILRITVSEYQNLRGVHLTTLPKIIFLNIKKENIKKMFII